jgi:hypothetical protein
MDGLSIKQNTATVLASQTTKDSERTGFTRAIGTQIGSGLSFHDLEADIV